jgi:hypothetical protein
MTGKSGCRKTGVNNRRAGSAASIDWLWSGHRVDASPDSIRADRKRTLSKACEDLDRPG